MSIWMNEEDVGAHYDALIATTRTDSVRYPQLAVAEMAPVVIYIRFTGVSECLDFLEDYGNIKHLIVEIDGLYENEYLSLSEYKLRLENQWIAETDGFIQRWGPELVLPEIRSTIDEVRDYLNIPKIEWPDDSFERVTVPIF